MTSNWCDNTPPLDLKISVKGGTISLDTDLTSMSFSIGNWKVLKKTIDSMVKTPLKPS